MSLQASDGLQTRKLARPIQAERVAPVREPGPSSSTGAAAASSDPASAYLLRLGAGSQRTMREALEKLARYASDGRCGLHELPWHLLGLEHTAALRTRLTTDLAPATANKHMAALRGVLRQCWHDGLLTAETYFRITDLPTIRGENPRPAIVLDEAEFARLVRTCEADPSPAGSRDAALLGLLRRSSLRRAEAVALDGADYDRAAGTLTIRAGARNPARPIALAKETCAALEAWLHARGDETGPLFNPVNKGGRIERRRLSEQAIYIACQKRASEAGLAPISPEDLRRA